MNEDQIKDALAVARAEERERCAKAIEAERDRVFAEEGVMLGEMAMYDVCAIIVRGLDGGTHN